MPIPERPTKEQARAALDILIDLLSEFPFAMTIDRSVALAGLLTAHVRGSLPTAPVILVRADTPGTGKSYLVEHVLSSLEPAKAGWLALRVDAGQGQARGDFFALVDGQLARRSGMSKRRR